jgi:hypothetical protein
VQDRHVKTQRAVKLKLSGRVSNRCDRRRETGWIINFSLWPIMFRVRKRTRRSSVSVGSGKQAVIPGPWQMDSRLLQIFGSRFPERLTRPCFSSLETEPLGWVTATSIHSLLGTPDNSRRKRPSAFLFCLFSVACRREDSNETTSSIAKRSTKTHKGES